MALASGTRLGTYTIASLLGAGGMGEVYRARDSKLERDVAIKVLPEQFARDPERLARFQREAKLLASLNHSNIATIHGFEQSGDTHYLVMELVPGETLRDRLLRERRVPVEEALAIAKQIAEALEAAHESEKGIIHRDLKPANVKVTPDGKVKVLDFGLAKVFATDAASEDFSNSPTLSVAATMHGAIMGTAAYMSPEQARGKPVTKATDIFAFGAVLYELLTGVQAFQGEDVGDILATVVKTEPDWSKLPEDTPPSIRTLLKRCLRKDRKQRLGDAGAVRIEIEDAQAWIAEGGAKANSAPFTGTVKGAASNRRLVALAAIAMVVAAAGWGAFAYFRPAPDRALAMRFLVSPPDTWSLTGSGLVSTAPLAVSPDGTQIAFIARSADGKTQMWVRALDALAAQLLTGTEGAIAPFWSPDGRFLGFMADGKLKKIELGGAAPVTLCDAPGGGRGTWNQDGTIIFSRSINFALQKVSAAGGIAAAASTLAEGESGHSIPFFLPDGRHFLYRAGVPGRPEGPFVYVASLDSNERKLLLTQASNVAYSQGHLLFGRGTTLMAQPFDAQRLELTGDAFPIAEQIAQQGSPSFGIFSASENGVLAYQTGEATSRFQMAWFDRAGKQVGILGDPGAYDDIELSPDGKRVSVSVEQSGNRDIWVYDVARGLRTRFTFDPGGDMDSAWSPDGSRLVFGAARKGSGNLYQKAASGGGAEEVLFEDKLGKLYLSWSPDGRFLLYSNTVASATTGTGNDLWALPLSGDRKPISFLQTQFNERLGQFSPDGRWVAYTSNESGRFEVYVAPFPGPGGRWQVSTAGGDYPRWRRDGSEIFYLSGDDKLTAVAVNGQGAGFEVGAAKPLFETSHITIRKFYDASPDGQRFLVITAPEQAAPVPMTVVVNWAAGVRK